MSSLSEIANSFIEDGEAIEVDVVINDVLTYKLSKPVLVKVRKAGKGGTKAQHSKKAWASHCAKVYHSFDKVGATFVELVVQQYKNGTLSERMHTTFGAVEFLWKHLQSKVVFHVDGIPCKPDESTLTALTTNTRTILLCEEMVVKEPLTKKRKRDSSGSSSASLIRNRIETMINGDNWLTITTKDGKPVVRIYPAHREQVFRQTAPNQIKTKTEYKIRISQYNPTTKWSKKTPPRSPQFLEKMISFGKNSRWQYIGGDGGGYAAYFSNFFDVKLGEWLIPVSATATHSDNISAPYDAKETFRRRLFQSLDEMCEKVLPHLKYPETRVVHKSDIVLRKDYTPIEIREL